MNKGIFWEVELSDLLNEGQEWMDWLIAPAQKARGKISLE